MSGGQLVQRVVVNWYKEWRSGVINKWWSAGPTSGGHLVQQVVVNRSNEWRSPGQLDQHMAVGCSNRWRSYETTCGGLVFLKW